MVVNFMKESIVRGSIEYIGISNDIPDNINMFRCFTLSHIIESYINIEEVIKIVARCSILEFNVIDTIEGISINNKKLTGKKLIVEGVCESKIQYIFSNKSEKNLETLKCSIPFCESIIVPSRCNKGNLSYVNAYINDINIRKTTSNLILTVSGILTVDIR